MNTLHLQKVAEVYFSSIKAPKSCFCMQTPIREFMSGKTNVEIAKWKDFTKSFFFLIFQIIQCDFPCSQTFRPAPNYTSIFLKFPPTHSTPRHFFLPTRSRCVPLLCCVCSKWQFISIFIISSVPSMITSMNALPFEREQREMNLYPPASPSLSPSLSTYQMYALLGRAKHMEMEPQQMGKSHTGSPDDIWIMNNREETALSYKQRCDVQDRPQFSPR